MVDPLWSETCWSNFRYFIILIVSTYCILCIGWIMKCSIIIVARCGHEQTWSSSGASALTRQFRGLRRHYSVWKCTRIQHHNRHTGTTSMPVRLQYEPFAKQFTWSWWRKTSAFSLSLLRTQLVISNNWGKLKKERKKKKTFSSRLCYRSMIHKFVMVREPIWRPEILMLIAWFEKWILENIEWKYRRKGT